MPSAGYQHLPLLLLLLLLQPSVPDFQPGEEVPSLSDEDSGEGATANPTHATLPTVTSDQIFARDLSKEAKLHWNDEIYGRVSSQNLEPAKSEIATGDGGITIDAAELIKNMINSTLAHLASNPINHLSQDTATTTDDDPNTTTTDATTDTTATDDPLTTEADATTTEANADPTTTEATTDTTTTDDTTTTESTADTPTTETNVDPTITEATTDTTSTDDPTTTEGTADTTTTEADIDPTTTEATTDTTTTHDPTTTEATSDTTTTDDPTTTEADTTKTEADTTTTEADTSTTEATTDTTTTDDPTTTATTADTTTTEANADPTTTEATTDTTTTIDDPTTTESTAGSTTTEPNTDATTTEVTSDTTTEDPTTTDATADPTTTDDPTTAVTIAPATVTIALTLQPWDNLPEQETIYGGVFTLLDPEFPESPTLSPHYQRKTPPATISYNNSTLGWFLQVNSSVSVKLSNSQNSYSPALWPEWECISPNITVDDSNSTLACTDLRNLTLRLKSPASLPPLHFKLTSLDDAFFAGDYTLESFNEEVDAEQFPVYKGPEDRKIYRNRSNDFWVLGIGNETKQDSVLRLSNSSTKNPANWAEEGFPLWSREGATEKPTLSLVDRSDLPPQQFSLVSFEEEDTTFYEGIYDLQFFPVNGMPEYVCLNAQIVNETFSYKKHLYVSSRLNFWVLGNAAHTDYIFNISTKSSEFSPLLWDDKWEATDISNSVKPVLRLKDPSYLPPSSLTFSPKNLDDPTFYAGIYELDIFEEHNFQPQYRRNQIVIDYPTTTRLYVNEDDSWILGHDLFEDYPTMVLSGPPALPPLDWSEWNNIASDYPENPELVLNSDVLLPPWQFKLVPRNSSDHPLYEGTYILNPEKLSPSNMPQFTRTSDDSNDQIDDVILYVSDKTNTWVLGTTDYKDYVFTISTNISSKSPIEWHEWEKSSSSSNESPELTLKDPTTLPPCTFQLLPNKTGDSPLYAGNYTLNLNETFGYADKYQYIKSLDETGQITLLYVNAGVWLLGDGDHKDYLFNLSSSNVISPVNWSEWTNTGSLETPALTKNNPFDLPPYKLTLMPKIGSDDTFYKGSYSLEKYADQTYNERPQYKHDNNSNLMLYMNRWNVWVLGDSGHNDFILNLTSADGAYSPFQWQQHWTSVNADTSPEIPTLLLVDPTFLPPKHLTLASYENGDTTFYCGSYSLNMTHRMYGRPIYSKQDNNVLLYVSESRGSWVLGNVDFEDYVFNISVITDVESPVNWHYMWNNTVESQEMPVMKLLDPTSLPPYSVTLVANTTEDEPFYAGTYVLNLTKEHNSHPYYYSRDSVTHLYANNIQHTTSIWTLGDGSFADYKVMVLCSLERSPPTWPSLWTECVDHPSKAWRHTETIENTTLQLVQAESLPPYKVQLKRSLSGSPIYGAGTYTLEIRDYYNGFPQYSSDTTDELLYVTQFQDLHVWSTNNAPEMQGENNNGHPLSRSRTGTFSPYFWEEWNNTGSIETPVLQLREPDFLAPAVELLASSNLTRQNFFVGTFDLIYQGFSGYPVYRRSDPSADIYVFNNTWVLGYSSHTYSYLKLSSYDPFDNPSPAQWNSSEWTVSQSGTEKPSLSITSMAAAFFPPNITLLLYLNISQEGIEGPDERDFTGAYNLDITLDITNETNFFPQYVMASEVRDAERRLYVSSQGMWMHGDPTSLESSFPISFIKAASETDDRLPMADSPLLWEEWELNTTGAIPFLGLKYSHRSVLYEALKTIPFHFFCMNENGERVDLIQAPELLCDGLPVCREVGEESSADENLSYNDVDVNINSCPFYVNPDWWKPLLMAAAITLIGMLFFFIAGFFIDDPSQEKEARKFTQIEKDLIDRVNYVIATKIEEFKQEKDPKNDLTEIMDFLHDSPGGMRLLIQTAFIYCPSLSKDTMKRKFALFLWAEEERIHGKGNRKDVLKCIRRKAGSNHATGLYLDHKLMPEEKKYHVNKWMKKKWKSVKEKWSVFVSWLKSKERAATSTRFLFKFGRIVLIVVKAIVKVISAFLIIPFVIILILFEATDFEFDGFLNLELFCFILDMVKDFLFWLYLNSRIEYLDPGSLTIALISLQLATIVMAQALMGLFILMRADKVFTWKKERWKQILSYVFLANPITWLFLPCTVVMKVSQLETEKTRLIDGETVMEHQVGFLGALLERPWFKDWRGKMKRHREKQQGGFLDALLERPWYRDWRGKVQRHREKKQKRREKVESPAALCLLCRDIDDQAIILRSMAASFILVEGTLESTPQLMIMFVFLFPDDTGFRDVIIGDSFAIFVVNTMFTVVSVFNAAISYANVMKREQLGSWQKLLLFLSAAFQILTRLLPMIAMATAKNVRVTIVALLLPVFFHWIIIGCLYIAVPPLRFQLFSKEVSRLDSAADLLLHVISNTFLSVPLRSLSDETQRRKGYEMVLLLVVNGLETLIIFFIGLGVFWNPDNPELQSAVRICWILSPVFFLLGCISLVLYYKFAHTWRHLEREHLSFLTWLLTTPKDTLDPADNFGFIQEESSATWEDWELNSQLEEEKKAEKEVESHVPEVSQVFSK